MKTFIVSLQFFLFQIHGIIPAISLLHNCRFDENSTTYSAQTHTSCLENVCRFYLPMKTLMNVRIYMKT